MCDVFHHLAKLLCIPFLKEKNNKNFQLLIVWVVRMLCSAKYPESLCVLSHCCVKGIIHLAWDKDAVLNTAKQTVALI